MNTERLLKISQVCERTGLSRSYIYQLVCDGLLAPPVKIGRASRWRSSDIADYVEGLSTSKRLRAKPIKNMGVSDV